MKKSLKTVSVAIPRKQFQQILDFMGSNQSKEKETTTVAAFLRNAITEFLSNQG